MMSTMTPIQYVKYRLSQDYGSRALIMIHNLNQRMAELLQLEPLDSSVVDASTVEGETDPRTNFQLLLDDAFYPFLACLQAMEKCGVEKQIANGYCMRIVEEMPEEIFAKLVRGEHQ